MSKKINIYFPITLIFLFIIAGFISSLSFENRKSVETGDTTYIKPLAAGNYWIYSLDSSGVIISVDTERVISCNDYYDWHIYGIIINSKSESETGFETQFYNNEPGGLWIYLDENRTSSGRITFLLKKYPVNENEIYNSIDKEVKCVSVNAEFNGFNGCIKYYYTQIIKSGDIINHYDYWKPGIGQIGEEYDYNGSHYIKRLIKYHLK